MPGLTVFRSNRLEVLAVALASDLRAAPPEDPCAPAEVVVGNRGMERWLKHQLAQHVGVCANVTFPFPTAVLDDALLTLTGAALCPAPRGLAPLDPWAPDALTWAVLELLPDLLSTPAFAPVRAYLDGDPDDLVTPRRRALARQLADIVDRYVTYRPELACALSAGAAPPQGPLTDALAWQVPLWRALAARLGPDAPHRAARFVAAEARMASAEPLTGLPPAPLRIFGVTTLPPAYLATLSLLARVIAVDLYVLCPSDQYWADLHKRRAPLRAWRPDDADAPDDVTRALRDGSLVPTDGPPLLISFGRVARDFQILLERLFDSYHDASPAQAVDAFLPAADPATALGRLQADIRDLAAPAAAHPLAPGDDSLQFHACHGPTRQVEVLRDALLHLLADHPHLEPRDVLVMTPDLDRYAPLVTAVFGDGLPERLPDGTWGDAGAPRLPFEITDLAAHRTNAVAAALLRLLELVTSRFEAPALLDLLALEPVRHRFDLSAEDLPRLATWVRDSGARWGLDAPHRAAAGQPADPANTWRFGLERLLLGATLADDGRRFAGLAPVDDVEGHETALLGKLATFVATLAAEREALRAPRPLATWVADLHRSLDRLTATPPKTAWLTRRTRDVLDQLAQAGALAQSALPLRVEALRDELTTRLGASGPGDRQQSGAITFSAMVPMRSIPYKVVALLGLDDGAFPRAAPRLAFDLTQLRPKVGDRNPRDEDRYLFLEALLAAREHLLLFYTGRSVPPLKPPPPAAPVSELRDVVDATFVTAPGQPSPSARLTTLHPLQPFSEQAFAPLHVDPHAPGPEHRRPWSFDPRLRSGALAAREQRAVPRPFEAPSAPRSPLGPAAPGAARERLSLERLARFLAKPTRYLLQSVLKASFDAREVAIAAREPIALDRRERWQVEAQALAAALAGDGPDALLAALRGAGRLPLGYAGEAATAAPWALAVVARDHAAALLEVPLPWPAPDPPLALDLPFGDLVLQGQLTRLHGVDLVDLAPRAPEGRRLLRPWLELLAWRAQGAPAGAAALVVGSALHGGAPKASAVQLLPDRDDPVAAARTARDHLAALLALYGAGTRHPLPLFPRASERFAWALRATPLTADDFATGLDAFAVPEVATALGEAQRAFAAADGPESPPGDLDDVYVRTLYPEGFPFWPDDPAEAEAVRTFAHASLTVWGPLYASRLTERERVSAAARRGPRPA